MKTSWWSLTIQNYPDYEPNDIDLEHIAECIKQGFDNGQLVQEQENINNNQHIGGKHVEST